MTSHTALPSRLLMRAARLATFLLSAFWLTGCANLKSGSEESAFSISALEDELQEAGVFVTPKGDALFGMEAEKSAILMLNSVESLTVYEFESPSKARDRAMVFAGENPFMQVFLRDRVVAIRRSPGDMGLTGTLRDILGNAL